jgi:hypothetical protein
MGEAVAHHGQGEQAESTKRQPPRDPLDPSRLPSTTDHERTEQPRHENQHPDRAVADLYRHRIRPVEQRSQYARSRYGPGSGEGRFQVFLAVGGGVPGWRVQLANRLPTAVRTNHSGVTEPGEQKLAEPKVADHNEGN